MSRICFEDTMVKNTLDGQWLGRNQTCIHLGNMEFLSIIFTLQTSV